MDKAWINGLACEDESNTAYLFMKCTDTFEDMAMLQGAQVQALVSCPNPKTCMTGPVKVWGNPTGYAPKSQACMAAHHSGKLKKSLAGYVVSVFNSGKTTKFTGSEANEILSSSIEFPNSVNRFQINTFD